MRKLEGPFYLFLAFALAGTSVISARIVSATLGTFVITAASLVFALLFLLPLCRKELLKTIRSLSGKEFIFIAMQAVFGIFLFRLCLLSGLLYTSAGEAGILTGATPAFTALMAMVILKEPLCVRKLMGILGTVVGILLIQGIFTGHKLSAEHLTGNLLVLGAAACESAFNILSRVMSVRQKPESRLNPIVQTALVSTFALLLCLIPAFTDRSFIRLFDSGLKEWLALLWYGAVVTAAAFICWYAGIKRCGAFAAAAFSGMMPFTAMLLSVIILKERIGWQQWAGGALVVAGMVLVGAGAVRAKGSQKRRSLEDRRTKDARSENAIG
jgi:drug/metabolite transporter (DMT)-like permease